MIGEILAEDKRSKKLNQCAFGLLDFNVFVLCGIFRVAI